MAKMIVYTQVYDNYGSEADPYWKAKGGYEYVIRNIDVNRCMAIAQAAAKQIDTDTPMFIETVGGWEVVEDDYLTEYERSQLEYEGKIVFPVRELIV